MKSVLERYNPIELTKVMQEYAYGLVDNPKQELCDLLWNTVVSHVINHEKVYNEIQKDLDSIQEKIKTRSAEEVIKELYEK